MLSALDVTWVPEISRPIPTLITPSLGSVGPSQNHPAAATLNYTPPIGSPPTSLDSQPIYVSFHDFWFLYAACLQTGGILLISFSFTWRCFLVASSSLKSSWCCSSIEQEYITDKKRKMAQKGKGKQLTSNTNDQAFCERPNAWWQRQVYVGVLSVVNQQIRCSASPSPLPKYFSVW